MVNGAWGYHSESAANKNGLHAKQQQVSYLKNPEKSRPAKYNKGFGLNENKQRLRHKMKLLSVSQSVGEHRTKCDYQHMA
jgi:hypothetical protein